MSGFSARFSVESLGPLPVDVDKNCRGFDGNDDKIVTNNNVNLNGSALTISAWVKIEKFTTDAGKQSTVAGMEERGGNPAALTHLATLNVGGDKASFAVLIGNTRVDVKSNAALKTNYWSLV